MKKILWIGVAAALALSISACNTTGTGAAGGMLGFNDTKHGEKFDETAVDKLVVGKSTKDEVIATLGKPASVTRLAGGKERLVWSYQETNETMTSKAANSGLAYLPIPGLGSLLGSDNKMTSKLLTVDLKDGVVVDYSVTEDSGNFGGGVLGG